MKSLVLRLAGFTFLPLLALILPFLLLPVVARVVGAPGWSSITAGQAVGVFAATVILWSWNISGPVDIARSVGARDRATIYSKSMRTRLVIASVVFPLMTLLVFAIAHDGFRLEAVSMAWATAMTGFSPAWYGIGAGNPKILAIYDTVPRFLAALVSAPLIIFTEQIWTYGAISILTTALSLMAFQRRFGEPVSWFPRNPVKVVREILPSTGVAAISFSGSAYASSPVPIATATVHSAGATAGFSSADNIYRLGLFSIIAVGNTFQGWTLEPSAANPRGRHLVAIYAHLLLGVLGAAFLVLFGPWVSGLIFGEALKADTLTSFFYGLSFFFLSASTPLVRNILIPGQRQRTVLLWTAISALLGIALMVSAGLAGNVPGIALGMAVSEAILLAGLLMPSLALLPPSAGTADREG